MSRGATSMSMSLEASEGSGSGRAATAQTDRLFSISLHGLTHTPARPALSSFSSNTPTVTRTHTTALVESSSGVSGS